MPSSHWSPPQSPPQWTHTPEQVATSIKSAINKAKQQYDQIGSLSPDQCNFDSVFTAISEIGSAIGTEVEPLIFYQNVSPTKELRDASNDAEALLRDFAVETEMRLDLFKAATNAKKNIEASNLTLTPEQDRLVEKTILDGVRAGLALPDEQRQKLTDVSISRFGPRACS